MDTSKRLIFIIEKSDLRLGVLKKLLEKQGYKTYELVDEEYGYNSETEYIFVMAPYTIITQAMAKRLGKKSLIFAHSVFDDAAKKILKEKEIEFIEYNDDEFLLNNNAMLTAEGALSSVIANTDKSLRNLNCLILGFGRVGKAVAIYLHSCGANVDISTDSISESALAKVYYGDVFSLKYLKERIFKYECIINTVPAKILKGDIISLIDKDAYFLDLASYPGGADFEALKARDIRYLHYLGVPAKIAKTTAGEYLYQSVIKTLKEKERI